MKDRVVPDRINAVARRQISFVEQRRRRATMAQNAAGSKTLIPSQQVEHLDRSQYWLATGPQPQFVIPCSLQAGWTRIGFSIESDVPSTLQVFADFGEGFSEQTCIAKVPVGRDTRHT